MSIEYPKLLYWKGPKWIQSFKTKDTAHVTSKQANGSRHKVKQGNLPNNKLIIYQAN